MSLLRKNGIFEILKSAENGNSSGLSQHYLESVQIRSYFWSIFFCIRTEYGEISVLSPNTRKYGPEIAPYLDTFHAVQYSK